MLEKIIAIMIFGSLILGVSIFWVIEFKKDLKEFYRINKLIEDLKQEEYNAGHLDI